MTHFSIELRYRVSLKRYGFFYFAKNIGKNIGKKSRGR